MISFGRNDLEKYPVYFCIICWRLYTNVKPKDFHFFRIGKDKAQAICKKCAKVVENVDKTLLKLPLPKISSLEPYPYIESVMIQKKIIEYL